MNMKILKTLILFGVVVICDASYSDDTPEETVPNPEQEIVNITPFRPNLMGPRKTNSFRMNGGIELQGLTPTRLLGPINNLNNMNVFNSSPLGSSWLYNYNLDDYFCPPNPSDFMALANKFETFSCYEHKKSYRKSPAGTVIDAEANKALILSDNEVCKCLKGKGEENSVLGKILGTDEVNFEETDVSRTVKNYETKLIDLSKKMAEKSLASSFQASIIYDGNKDVTEAYKNNLGQEFLGAIQESKTGREREKGGVKGLIHMSTDAKSVSSSKDQSEGTSQIERFFGAGKKNREAFEAGIKKVNESFKVPEPNLKILSEDRYQEGQCIGGREFLAFKQLPDGDDIFQELAVADFKEQSWNYNNLKQDYKKLMDLSAVVKAEPGNAINIKRIKAKMKFLNKNPMIKSLLAAQDNYDDYFSRKNSSNEYKRDINSIISGGKLSKNKKALFDIMKKMASDNVCNNQGKSADCLRKSLKNGKYEDYKKDLKNFFSNPEVGEVARIESKYDLFRDFDNFKNDRIGDPKKLPLTQEALYTSFVNETGLDPERCMEGNIVPDSEMSIKCAQIFSPYCKRIEAVVPRLDYETENSDIADDLELTSAYDFNPDFETNPNLRDFNKEICSTPRKKNLNDPNETPLNFFSFKVKYCEASSKPECFSNSNESTAIIRLKFMDEYKASFSDDEVNFNLAMKIDRVESMNKEDAAQIAKKPVPSVRADGTRGSGYDDAIQNWKQVAQSLGTGNTADGNNLTPGLREAFNTQPAEKDVAFSSIAQGLNNLSSAMGGNSEAVVDDGSQMNYSNAIMGGAQTPGQTSEAPKVENMAQTEREELLDDWKKEMADWKANKNNADPAQSAVASANEASMKSKIEALEQLLAQQKKLTDDQYKLINDSIASQTRTAERSIASAEDDSDDDNRAIRRKGNNGIVGSNGEVGDETQRAPGSVPEQLNTSGSGGGSALGGASSRSRTSGSNAISDSSRDSVAREEAKLVNLRENTNGSITVTASSSGSSAANAIVVPVNDALYLSAQSNPNGFSLSQIEQSIPKEQIAKLQDKGDFFILLLQNGTNPPLEVKVRKGADNKLVQVEGAPIISRRVSLDSLRNTLPSPVPVKR